MNAYTDAITSIRATRLGYDKRIMWARLLSMGARGQRWSRTASSRGDNIKFYEVKTIETAGELQIHPGAVFGTGKKRFIDSASATVLLSMKNVGTLDGPLAESCWSA